MMMATVEMLLSGMLGALSNLCMRRSMDARGSMLTFFLFQLTCTFLVVTYMHPIRSGNYSINLYTVALGVVCGLLLGVLKYLLNFAIKKGPASLTFASMNCASVAPAIIIALGFSAWVDFPYTFWQAVGSFLVVVGLIWAINDRTQFLQKRKWLLFAGAAFFIQTLFLLGTQFHALILENGHWVDAFWRKGAEELASNWFGPVIFATAAIMHFIVYFITEERLPDKREVFWGTAGGIANGLCAYLFIHSVEVSTPHERALLFPVFSVALIVACNLWGEWFYKERINWKANLLCLVGLVTGSS